MEKSKLIQDALFRLMDAQSGISREETHAAEELWHFIGYQLAPVAEQLINDLRTFPSGAWTLDVFLADKHTVFSQWHQCDDKWHRRWQGYDRARIAQFYFHPVEGLSVMVGVGKRRAFDVTHPGSGTVEAIIDRAAGILAAHCAIEVPAG